MSAARDRMLDRFDDARQPPAVQRDRARRRARAACDSADQALLLSRTVQRLGSRAFTMDARIDAVVERVMGGERHNPTRAAKAVRQLKDAHDTAMNHLAQLRAALNAREQSADFLMQLVAHLEGAVTRLNEAIEARA